MPAPTAPVEPGSRNPLSPGSKLCSLPPFSRAAARLLQLSENEGVELSTIKSVLASDPAMAADVLRLANSPMFAIRNEIRSIDHAVVFLGLERIKALANSIAMRRYAAGNDGAYRRCWEHSLGCALVAEELAELFGIRNEDAYTAGLLHDIGRVGLLKAYFKEYLPVLNTEYQSFDESRSLEQCLIGIDHCQSGSFLAKVWAFPRSLQTVAESHHPGGDADESDLTELIRVACAVTEAIGFAEVRYEHPAGMDDTLERLEGSTTDAIKMRVSFIEERTRQRMADFGR